MSLVTCGFRPDGYILTEVDFDIKILSIKFNTDIKIIEFNIDILKIEFDVGECNP